MTPTPGSNSTSSPSNHSNPAGSHPSGTSGSSLGVNEGYSRPARQETVHAGPPQEGDLVKDSLLYKEFVAERDEILRHKWIESEKAGHDIGFEKALLDWVLRYRAAWRLQRSGGAPMAGTR